MRWTMSTRTTFIVVPMPMPMFFNESMLLIFHGNEPILSACGNRISFWLFNHFCYTWFVTFVVLFPPVTSFVLMIEPLVTWYERYQQRLGNFSRFERDYSRSAVIRRYILHEIRLTCIYVSFALFYALLTNHASIHLIRFFYWLIEASFVPFTWVNIVCVYIYMHDGYLFDFNCKLTCLWVYMLKGGVFVWIRYTEWYPSSILNDVQTFMFYHFCNQSKLHQMPNDHYFRDYMDRLERSSMSS